MLRSFSKATRDLPALQEIILLAGSLDGLAEYRHVVQTGSGQHLLRRRADVHLEARGDGAGQLGGVGSAVAAVRHGEDVSIDDESIRPAPQAAADDDEFEAPTVNEWEEIGFQRPNDETTDPSTTDRT